MEVNLDQEEICNVAAELCAGLIRAEANLSYLRRDPSISRLIKLLKSGLSIACCDFDTSDYESDSGFKWLPEQNIFLLNKLAVQRLFDHAKNLKEYAGIETEKILSDILGIYLFHELFHIPQGIPEFGLVQKVKVAMGKDCLLYTSPSPRDKRQSRMPSSA